MIRKMWLGIFVLIMVFVFYFPIMQNHTQSFKFVDEDEYLVNAWLMNKGKRLYTDISTNHQPITYVASQFVQTVSEPANVFMLIKRHREAVYLWSFLWSIVLFIRFGWKVIPGIFVFEAIKYFILGNEFVAESLVSYPMIYLAGSTIELLGKNKIREGWIFGFLSAMSVLFLLPMIIPVVLMVGIRVVKLGRREWKNLVLGAACLLLPLSLYISPGDYVRETIINNYKYALPAVSEVQNLNDLWSVLTFVPRSIIEGENLLSWWTRIFSLIWLVYLGREIKLRRGTEKWLPLSLLALLVILNLRVLEVGTYYYAGFHLLPWLAVAGVGASIMWFESLMKEKRGLLRGAYLGISLLIAGSLLVNENSPVMAKKDTATEHYVQFAPVATTAQVINLFKNNRDTLIVLPNEVLINWITDLDTTDRQVTYYDWQYQVPLNRDRFYNMLEHNPPDFIVFDDDKSDYIGPVSEITKTEYLLLYEYGIHSGGMNGLYMHKDKLNETTKVAWDELINLPIEIPDITRKWYDENF